LAKFQDCLECKKMKIKFWSWFSSNHIDIILYNLLYGGKFEFRINWCWQLGNCISPGS
jgi:hypothetical protein